MVARFLFVCVRTSDLHGASYWIDTLVLKTEGNTYATLLHHPFLFKGKPRQCSRGSSLVEVDELSVVVVAGTEGDREAHLP